MFRVWYCKNTVWGFVFYKKKVAIFTDKAFIQLPKQAEIFALFRAELTKSQSEHFLLWQKRFAIFIHYFQETKSNIFLFF